MSKPATGRFRVSSWEESVIKQLGEGTRLTRASVEQSYTGDLEGTGSVEYTMFYRQDGTASFIGLEYFAGQVGGKAGSVVIRHDGNFENGIAKSTWSVLTGSGAEELENLRGEGSFVTLDHEQASYKFEYDLD